MKKTRGIRAQGYLYICYLAKFIDLAVLGSCLDITLTENYYPTLITVFYTFLFRQLKLALTA